MVAKWGIILGAFDIKYMPRTSIKGQVLADLVAEFIEPPIEELESTENMDKKIGWHNLPIWPSGLGGIC